MGDRGRLLAVPFAILLAVAVYVATDAAGVPMPDDARATAAVAVLMAGLWMTEAIPLAATALLPFALLPLFGVMTVRDAAAAYGQDVVFLFLGGFLVAQAVERWGLHRRIALRILGVAGSRPAAIVGGFMAATAFLSMWISNTAAAAIMLPVGISVVVLVGRHLTGDRSARDDGQDFAAPTDGDAERFAASLMLAIAYAASVGGTATLIGTPPNAILASLLKSQYGVDLGFGRWLLIGLPVAGLFLVLMWIFLTRVLHPVRGDAPQARAEVARERAALGPLVGGERLTFVVFSLTALSWMLREPLTRLPWLRDHLPFVATLTDGGIAIVAGVLLFVLPADARRGQRILDEDAFSRLPWPVLVLMGGGLALAEAIRRTGLDVWIGGHLTALSGLPAPIVVLLLVTTVIFASELMSNTALAAALLPIVGGYAAASATPAAALLLPATFAASYAFMMPVGTPPNAIVYGSGRISMRQMMRTGLWLNLVAVAVLTLAAPVLDAWMTYLVGPLVRVR